MIHLAILYMPVIDPKISGVFVYIRKSESTSPIPNANFSHNVAQSLSRESVGTKRGTFVQEMT